MTSRYFKQHNEFDNFHNLHHFHIQKNDKFNNYYIHNFNTYLHILNLLLVANPGTGHTNM